MTRKVGRRPKWTRDANPILRMMNARQELTQQQQIELGLAYRIAFNKIISGKGEVGDLHTLAASLNIALILAERGVASDSVELIKSAQQALVDTFARAEKYGRFGFTGPGFTAVRDALLIHDAQLGHTDKGLMRTAIGEVMRRVDSGDVIRLEVQT
jgi:hypothetical protein